MSRGFYNYDTRGASLASQIIHLEQKIERLEAEQDALQGRVRVTEINLVAALQTATELAAERDSLRALLAEARQALAGGLWDYGPGQDEHAKCNEAIARIDAALAAQQQPTAPPCPHIRSSGEGTHWCALAAAPQPSAEPLYWYRFVGGVMSGIRTQSESVARQWVDMGDDVRPVYVGERLADGGGR